MSLWLQSFVWELEDEENEKKKMAIAIKYLSMPIPRSWWEHSLENEEKLKEYTPLLKIIYEQFMIQQEWKDYGILIALPFIGNTLGDSPEDFNSILENAKRILEERPEIKALGRKILKYLR